MIILGYIALGLVAFAIVALFAFALWPAGPALEIAPSTIRYGGILNNALGGIL